ncbi:DUF973 family protein [Acidianus manzaensis]|uniref:DUF973 domain-containing protein n=1 Tax=Acidianus manzaensis TaxID=282676 RepID=A0A1W6K2W1_9CREN|nr:DUF973 family protein [Acidianus manzaensis]ARM76859.1 hypothetical protein B6F84_13070 [Acidianus manzaensis]
MESQIQAMKNVKDGSLYYLVAVIVDIGLIFGVIVDRTFGLSFEFLIIELASYFVLIYGFTKLRYGFYGLSKFYDIRSNLGTAGINTFIFGIIAILFSDIFLPLLYVGVILIVGGDVLIGLTFYDIGKHYENNLTIIAGILIGLTVTLPIGYIISYVASSEIIEKISKIPPKPPMEITVKDKTIGYGILKSTGLADFKVYSNVQAEIVSAQIQGYDLPVLDITPKSVNPGENSIKVKFSLSGMFTPGNIYNVELLLSNNEKLIASLVYEM